MKKSIPIIREEESEAFSLGHGRGQGFFAHPCSKNSKCAFDKNLYGHFCPRRKAANFCHPVQILADNSGPKLAPGLQSSPVGRHAGFNFPFITFVAGRYC